MVRGKGVGDKVIRWSRCFSQVHVVQVERVIFKGDWMVGRSSWNKDTL